MKRNKKIKKKIKKQSAKYRLKKKVNTNLCDKNFKIHLTVKKKTDTTC